jgi:hypothetical protein
VSLTRFVHVISPLAPFVVTCFSGTCFPLCSRIESNCRSIRHACRRQPNRRRTRRVSALFSVIATEASNFLPLFYRSPIPSSYSLPSIPASDPWLLLAGTLPFISYPYRASLRIGLRCLHSPPCRTPARISGKDFPLPFSTGSNQPPLTRFFPIPPLPSPFTFTCLFLSLSALYAIIVHSLFFYKFSRLPPELRHLRALHNRSFMSPLQKTERNGKVSTLLR